MFYSSERGIPYITVVHVFHMNGCSTRQRVGSHIKYQSMYSLRMDVLLVRERYPIYNSSTCIIFRWMFYSSERGIPYITVVQEIHLNGCSTHQRVGSHIKYQSMCSIRMNVLLVRERDPIYNSNSCISFWWMFYSSEGGIPYITVVYVFSLNGCSTRQKEGSHI